MAVLPGDLVLRKKENTEENIGEQLSKEDQIERVEVPENFTFHDVLVPIPGCKVKASNKRLRIYLNVIAGFSSNSFQKMIAKFGLRSCWKRMVLA